MELLAVFVVCTWCVFLVIDTRSVRSQTELMKSTGRLLDRVMERLDSMEAQVDGMEIQVDGESWKYPEGKG